MAYIKYGIVTKIKIIKNIDKSNIFIKKTFNLNLYTKKDKTYYLKEEVLSSNIKSFRKEVMKYTNNVGDSLNNCEAYSLEIPINKLINNNIKLISYNEKYSFSCNKSIKFETDQTIISDNDIKIKLFIIPIFWDINSVTFENPVKISNFINNLTKKAMNNTLKDASFLVVI